MSELEFPDGMYIKEPHPRSPDFVKGKISIDREKLIAWLQKKDDEWINIDIKVSRAGNWYMSVDNWKPDPDRVKTPADPPANKTNPDDYDDDIPF